MRKKYFAIIIAIILIAFLGWKLYQRVSASLKGSIRQHRVFVAVEVMPVQKRTIREVGIFVGTLLPKSQFIAAPKIAGRLEQILVNIGDQVKQGQLIAVLDDDEYIQQVEQTRAEVEVAKANVEENRSALNLAQREFERAKALREKKIVSESELDAAEAHYKAQIAKQKVALAQVAQKEAILNSAQIRLSYARIKASWEDGNELRVVGERFVDEGALLKANDPIVSILDIRSLTAVIHVIEHDYSRVKVGQVAVVTTDAFPDRVFNGTIIRVAPLLKETARQARVELEIPNSERLLKPGMFVRVNIEFARHEDVTVVPLMSLTKRNDQQGIFLADTQTKKAQFVPVTLGIVNGKWAEVVTPTLSGLVVTVGQHLLEDGSSITLPEKQPETSSPESTDSRRPKREQPSSGANQ
jgi:RND family efflux transporter MFP subunit